MTRRSAGLAPGPLERKIAARIRAQGPVTFSDYMRECLYDPEWGYYSHPETRRFADFYTSVDVHPLFGRLLARQLAEMWRMLDCPPEFCAVEAGAGTGRLASHILDFAARELPDFYEVLCYVAVEQSAARRANHAEMLSAHIDKGRAASASHVPAGIRAGCVLSKEFLDAMRAHRLGVEQGELRGIYIAVRVEERIEITGPLSTPEIEGYFRKQGITLREGQQAEVGLEAAHWIADIGARLGRGFVLTIDYGHETGELYDERHMRGTMLAYLHHRADENFLRAPGQQDLTCHVNFTALDVYGREAGLRRTGCVSQMAFLVALGHANEFADLYEPGATEVERIRARLKLKTLIHPEGMGETFHVFIQHKGISAPQLTGLAGI